tara:strand:- start:1794 stop:2126 length:333 start_codon:yes stop_codon:yes gene_type:complete
MFGIYDYHKAKVEMSKKIKRTPKRRVRRALFTPTLKRIDSVGKSDDNAFKGKRSRRTRGLRKKKGMKKSNKNKRKNTRKRTKSKRKKSGEKRRTINRLKFRRKSRRKRKR